MKSILLLATVLICLMETKAQDTIVKRNGEKIISKILEITPSEIKYKLFGFMDGPTYIELKSKVEKIIFSNGIQQVFKQENYPMPPSAYSIPYYEYTSEKIEFLGGKFRYRNGIIGEKAMQTILLNTKNDQIKKMVAQAQSAQRTQYIGFAAIPLGLAALLLFSQALEVGPNSYNNNYNSYNGYGRTSSYDESEYNTYISLSLVFLGGAITCPIIAGICKSTRNKYNRKAIELYNKGL